MRQRNKQRKQRWKVVNKYDSFNLNSNHRNANKAITYQFSFITTVLQK